MGHRDVQGGKQRANEYASTIHAGSEWQIQEGRAGGRVRDRAGQVDGNGVGAKLRVRGRRSKFGREGRKQERTIHVSG